jgi:hypothetical protein
LQVPAEQDLISRLVVGLGDAGDHLMLREGLDACAATTQREPFLFILTDTRPCGCWR